MEAAQPSEAASDAGGDQEPGFHFNNAAIPATSAATIELEIHSDGPVPPAHNVGLAAILDTGTAAVDDHAASNSQHHVKAILPHDLLI